MTFERQGFVEILANMQFRGNTGIINNRDSVSAQVTESMMNINSGQNGLESNFIVIWKEKIFDLKIRKIKWGAEECFSLLFNDITDKEAIIAAK